MESRDDQSSDYSNDKPSEQISRSTSGRHYSSDTSEVPSEIQVGNGGPDGDHQQMSRIKSQPKTVNSPKMRFEPNMRPRSSFRKNTTSTVTCFVKLEFNTDLSRLSRKFFTLIQNLVKPLNPENGVLPLFINKR